MSNFEDLIQQLLYPPLLTREEIGRFIRDHWIRWSRTQPDIDDHPGWLTPWALLEERHREVDCYMGEELVRRTLYDSGLWPGMAVISRDGQHGTVVGRRKMCRLEGCTGYQVPVRWDDGSLTHLCIKSMSVDLDGTWRIKP